MWFNFIALAATPSATIIPIPTPIPLTISFLPQQVTKGQTFSATLNIQAKTNQNYQFKIYGGVNGDNYSIDIQNGDDWINGYNGAWDSLPKPPLMPAAVLRPISTFVLRQIKLPVLAN